MIDTKSLASSTISTVAYDDQNSTLYVEFRNGSRYKYAGIPKLAFANICVAPSPGKYLQQIAKNYKAEKYA